MRHTWYTPGPVMEVRGNDVHVWLVRVPEELARLDYLAGLLAANETDRASHFVFEKDKNRYIVARGSLRLILSRYLGMKPGDMRFTSEKRDKPVLDAAHRRGLSFNLSHSSDYVIYAVARDRDVGIDIEYVKPSRDHDQIVNQFFSKKENREYFALPAHARGRAFFTCWTRKEAFIKAVGVGLSLPLDKFSVSPNPLVQAGIEMEADYSIGSEWILRDLKLPDEQYVSALVVAGADYDLTCWRWHK